MMMMIIRQRLPRRFWGARRQHAGAPVGQGKSSCYTRPCIPVCLRLISLIHRITHPQTRPSRIVLVKRDAKGDREVIHLWANGRRVMRHHHNQGGHTHTYLATPSSRMYARKHDFPPTVRRLYGRRGRRVRGPGGGPAGHDRGHHPPLDRRAVAPGGDAALGQRALGV